MKYPAVYTYRSTQDKGQELRYSIRSLKNIQNWDGTVYVIGDKEDWFSPEIKYIKPNSKPGNPYRDVSENLAAFNSLQESPQKYIYMMDDVYVTEPSLFSTHHRGLISNLTRKAIHTGYVIATGEYLQNNNSIGSPLNYEVHSPFLVDKTQWMSIYPIVRNSVSSGVPLQWKSLYGNLFNIGGELVEDKKTYDSHLLSGIYISTSFFTHELKDMFPEPSIFEHRSKRIAIVSHFSPIKMTTGMIKLVNYIAEHLSTQYQVDVIATRETFPPSIKIGNVGYYLGINQLKNLNDYDLVIAHPPMNIIDHPNLVLFYDSDKDVGKPNDPKFINHKQIIFTTKHIRKQYNQDGIILHPVVLPEQHRTERGDKIVLIGASEYKGINVLESIAKLMPEKQFLVVKSGWQKELQKIPNLPNVTSMGEVNNLKDIWNKTHILISPSKGEQYGMASLEAMASGIPVIAYKCPGVDEALGDAAELLDTFKAEAWVESIRKVEDSYADYVKKSEEQSKLVDSKKELNNLMKEINKICPTQ